GRAGLGLIAAFVVSVALLGDVRRTGAFFAGFFLIVPVFLTVVVFLRVPAFAAGAFLRFAFALPFAFCLVAPFSVPTRIAPTGSCAAVQAKNYRAHVGMAAEHVDPKRQTVHRIVGVRPMVDGYGLAISSGDCGSNSGRGWRVATGWVNGRLMLCRSGL